MLQNNGENIMNDEYIDNYSDDIYKKYSQLSEEELKACHNIFSRLVFTPHHYANNGMRENVKKFYNELILQSPKLQRNLLSKGILFTLITVLSVVPVLGGHIQSMRLYQKLTISCCIGAIIGFSVFSIINKLLRKKHQSINLHS